MKKTLAFISATTLYLFSAANAFATELQLCPKDGIAAGLCDKSKDPTTGFGSIISTLINGAFVLAIVAALGYLIYGGVKWILSQGDKTKVEGARNHVVAAVLGLVIVFMSYLILNIVVKIFTGSDLSHLTLPSI
jgi:hypothetical protein